VVRIVVSGVCGRTGTAVAVAADRDPDVSLVGGVERPGSAAEGADLSEAVAGVESRGRIVGHLEELDPDDFDVVVDFSTPEQSVSCAEYARRTGKGLVTGTTGLTVEQTEALGDAALGCALVAAPNMSIGANTLFALVAEAASALGEDFDVEITEAHHSSKKDAPSGTALRLVRAVAQTRGVDPAGAMRTGRSGPASARQPGEIGVHSIRGGAVVGRHTVHFISPLETVTLVHDALSRAVFAAGALRAARFVASAAPGLYDMTDVLGL
jgi:4-hydroxy-tetrahydrodipicolinate reductase